MNSRNSTASHRNTADGCSIGGEILTCGQDEIFPSGKDEITA